MPTLMKRYLSFGGGVNSVAMILALGPGGYDEAVFVDHGTDWPETYEYLEMFQEWLVNHGYKPITVLRPKVQGESNLYDYCWQYRMVPSWRHRWCTSKFKVLVLHKHFEPPCFELIGIDAGESRRAKISSVAKIESRWPLIEEELDRNACLKLIDKHGLPHPMKSGCYICPYQRPEQWRELRRDHPELFCKAEQLEARNLNYRAERGKAPFYLSVYCKTTLRRLIQEDQGVLFDEMEYPPCQCMT